MYNGLLRALKIKVEGIKVEGIKVGTDTEDEDIYWCFF